MRGRVEIGGYGLEGLLELEVGPTRRIYCYIENYYYVAWKTKPDGPRCFPDAPRFSPDGPR